jgi:hypothetical protein
MDLTSMMAAMNRSKRKLIRTAVLQVELMGNSRKFDMAFDRAFQKASGRVGRLCQLNPAKGGD